MASSRSRPRPRQHLPRHPSAREVRLYNAAQPLQKVWDSVMAAARHPLSPVKINAVAMRGVNDDEIQTWRSLRYESHARQVHRAHALNGDTTARASLALHPGVRSWTAPRRSWGSSNPSKRRPYSPRRRVPLPMAPGTFGVINAGLGTLLRPLQQATPDGGRQDSSLSPHRPGRARKGRHPLGRPYTCHPQSSLGDGAQSRQQATLPEETRHRTMSQIEAAPGYPSMATLVAQALVVKPHVRGAGR